MNAQLEQHAHWSAVRERLGLPPAEVRPVARHLRPEPMEPVYRPNMPLWERIAAQVACKHDMTLREMLDYGRSPRTVAARAEAYWRCREETAMSFKEIGTKFGRDHATVMHSVKRYEKSIGRDASVRHEFSKKTKREALKRSQGYCEANDPVYGLEPGIRCNAPLSYGVEFDHWPIPATDKGSDTLDNCMAVCALCHGIKTRSYDIPMQAKGKRISDKHLGIVKPHGRIQSRGFDKSNTQRARRERERTEREQ